MTTEKNKHILREMTIAVDDVMTIMRDGVLFEGVPDAVWEKLSAIQEKANSLKGDILEIERML